VRPLIGTSLKMNFTSSEAAAFFDRLRPMVAPLTSCELFVLPPFTSIWVARDRLRDSNVAWGAQDVHAEDSGAHTGDVSARMLADLGCTFVEVGHSERRRDHGESDEHIAQKVRQVLRHQMTPIICVGEASPGSPEAALDHVLRQARTGMSLVPDQDRSRVVIAYEPVWAIGTGKVATPEQAASAHRGIRATLDRVVEAGLGAELAILYGGSVSPVNAPALFAEQEIDGALVGGASLEASSFWRIVEAAG
jgi:triosephosphate isomerase